MSAHLQCTRCLVIYEAKRSDAQFCGTCKIIRAQERAAQYDTKKKEPCPQCGALMVRRAQSCRRCENQRRVKAYVGNNNPNWRAGLTKADGYILERVQTGTPGKGKGAFYRGQHIVIWEAANGSLPKGWVVHHLNGIKDDNRIENLMGMTRNEHHKHPREALRPYEARIRDLADLANFWQPRRDVLRG